MSTFSHIDPPPMFNAVVGTTVPPRWSHLVSHELLSSSDTSLSGVTRTIFAAPNPTSPIHGELWAISPSSPAPTFKITQGHLQLYVVSGADSLTKNGQVIFIRPGEKVAFKAGDTFSFNGSTGLHVLARNESATFSTSEPIAPLSQIRPPSDEQVQVTRAMLGLPSGSASTPEETSSRGYWRVRMRH